jgi:hypothetical protein
MAKKDLKKELREAERQRDEAKHLVRRAQDTQSAAKRQMEEISRWSDLKRQVRDTADSIHEKFVAWDTVRELRFNAKLDEAEAKLRGWKADYKFKQAQQGMKEHDALSTLEEQTALARARLSEWNHSRHERKAEEALEDAARHFDQAYDAAASRFDR